MLVAMPHPDAVHMPMGPTSPKPAVIEQHAAHLVVTAFSLANEQLSPDITMGKLTAAVIRSSPAVAAMYGHGAMFHDAELFAGFVAAAGDAIATEVAVDITAAQEGPGRMSFLTHGLDRYGREEFFVTSSTTDTGALEYVMALVRWMIVDRDKVLPTGDTVGRTADERVVIQRVPSPIPDKAPVIRLDLDLDDAAVGPSRPTKKKGLFRRR